MTNSDRALRELISAIVEGDAAPVSRLLAASPELAKEGIQAGATRQAANEHFIDPIKRYVVAGDTAMHIAAAAYQTGILRELIRAGADVRGRNRFGDEALHAAAVGSPGSHRWNPAAQSATIVA